MLVFYYSYLLLLLVYESPQEAAMNFILER